MSQEEGDAKPSRTKTWLLWALRIGGTAIGQGTHTMMAQVVAAFAAM